MSTMNSETPGCRLRQVEIVTNGTSSADGEVQCSQKARLTDVVFADKYGQLCQRHTEVGYRSYILDPHLGDP